MAIEYLDPEIANEGLRADDQWTPDGEFQSFMDPPVIPDYAFVKQKGAEKLRKYFPQYSGIPYKHQHFPMWVYHATKEPRLLRTMDHAKEHGLTYNDRFKAFIDDESEWKLTPVFAEGQGPKLNPAQPGAGKVFVRNPANQGDNIAAIVSAVMAQFQQMSITPAPAPATPFTADPEYQDYLKFKAFQASQGAPKTVPVVNEEDQRVAALALLKERRVKGVKDDMPLSKLTEMLDSITK